MKTVTLNVVGTRSCDVFVAGGGVAGCAAALSAARRGAKVILAERWGSLGGSATMGCVIPLSAARSKSGKPFGGLCEELSEDVKALAERYAGAEPERALYAPHVMKYVLIDKLAAAGVELMLQCALISAETENGRVASVCLATKSGLIEIAAKTFVDATGDADLAAMAGADYALGAEPEAYEQLAELGMSVVHVENGGGQAYRAGHGGGMQPVSAMLLMGGVEPEQARHLHNRMPTFEELGIDPAEFKRRFYAGTPGFEENGELVPLPQGRIWFMKAARPGEVIVNMSRVVGVNATDEEQVSRAEIVTQRQVMALADFMRAYVPGFENAYLIESSWALGVRESRRILGGYVLTGADAVLARRFEDAVAKGSYIIDIHDPYGRQKAIGGEIRGDSYDIPYRCLYSRNIANLAAAGRCISADHIAHSSARVQGTSILTGQAAGTAAALCAQKGVDYAALDARELREALIGAGVRL